MDKERAIEYVAKALETKGAKIYEYSGRRFVAVLNENGKSNLAITFGDENMTMEFATQSARFAYGDENDLVAHTENFFRGSFAPSNFITAKRRCSAVRELCPKNRLKRLWNSPPGMPAEMRKRKKISTNF